MIAILDKCIKIAKPSLPEFQTHPSKLQNWSCVNTHKQHG